ncbi:hypothetical protein FPRO03_10648 [Fusarium proliferatum]|nr:hypothetical protein FPRO03_10648 [Fusarium proliferatum]
MAPKALTNLPSEIRQQIFRECLQVDGGYVYDVQTDKLTNADGTAIDLSLLYTCRSIANDTRAMPLAVNTIQFSTVFRQDWCNLAGCFALAATTHYVLEQDFVFHLAKFITPEMFTELESICPGFQQLLEFELVEHNRWIHENNDPGYYFQTVKFRPAVCSMERVAHMMELFEIGPFVWELPATWYYTPRSFYDQVVEGAPQDRRSPEFEKPDNLLEHFTSRCREKLRFSATAAAIRFIKRLTISQRKQMRRIVLHEDLPSVNLPSRHTQGLIPFLKENHMLRVERRASVFGCVTSQRPHSIIAYMDSDEDIPLPTEIANREFEASIYYWLLDAFAVADSGVSTNCFTFVLEAGQHRDYCADLFQKVIQTEISKSKAWKICLDTGLLAPLRQSTRDRNATRFAKDPRFEKLIDQLANQTSNLWCDFNPGAPLDVDALVEDAKVKHGETISDKWVSKSDFDVIPLPYDLYHDTMVAPNFEFQTRQEYIESRGVNDNAEDS